MKIDMISRMIPFFDFAVVEKISVDAVKHNFVAMKINHLSGAVHFGKVDIESDVISDHLSVLADSLNRSMILINPPAKKPSKLNENFGNLAVVVENEHKRLLARKSIIEKRKKSWSAKYWKRKKKRRWRD